VALGCLVWSLAAGSLARAEAEEETPEPESVRPTATWSTGSPIGPIAYRAGRGLTLEKLGLTIGGFTSLELEVPKRGSIPVDPEEPDEVPDDSGEFSLDSINFLVLFQPVEQLRLFMEVEVGDLFSVNLDSGEVESDATAFFERLYGDIALDDAYNLRIGKYQTPVGRWNLVPAEPFTWTATEPLLLETFDEHQTGAAAFGTFFPSEAELSYWVYGQFTDAFDVEEDEEPADYSVGGRLVYTRPLDNWSVGASFLASELNDRWNYLGGLDAQLRIGPFEGTMEFVYRDGDLEDGGLWDIYIQTVYEMFNTVYFVGRYEHSHPLGAAEPVNVADFGITWIPKPFLIFKATYRFADRPVEEDPAGFRASFSVLF